jgi:hypothetical protein
MLKVVRENIVSEQDRKVVSAFEDMLVIYPNDTLESLWEEIQNANFENHTIGKGGSHIWIVRKADNKRIAIVE